MQTPLIDVWVGILEDQKKTWVLFKHGTCVILDVHHSEPATVATALLKSHGLVQPGSPAGDFSVIRLKRIPGWVVTYHLNNIMTYVDEEEVSKSAEDVEIGVHGRSKRLLDAQQLEVVHIHLVDTQSTP